MGYFHFAVPDKPSVLREAAAPFSDGMVFPGEDLEKNAPAPLLRNIVALTDNFRRQQQKYPLYLKTDSPLSVLGCFCAYQMLCARMGIPQREELGKRLTSPLEGVWDLGGKLKPPVREMIHFCRFGLGCQRVHANEIVLGRENGHFKSSVSLHVGSQVTYRNLKGATSTKKHLLFGDSFSEYRPHYLTGMLAETVAEITFVWSTSVEWDLVREIKPDILVTEIAERFMNRVPTDDIDIRAHAAEKLEWAKSRQAAG